MEDIKDLLVKYIAGSATPEESSHVEEWLEQDPAHLEEYAALEQAWRDARWGTDPAAFDAKPAFEKLRRNLGWPAEGQRRPVRLFYKVAAALGGALIVGGAAYFYSVRWNGHPSGSEGTVAEQIVVPKGQKKHLVLSDSTEIWLNAGSTLRIEPGFGVRQRNVFLEGEGYFKVRHDSNLVFTVATRNYTIRDIGTAFNVNTYPGDTHFETAVLEGEISVEGHFSRNNKPSRIILSHNQVLKIRKTALASITDSLISSPSAPGPVNKTSPGRNEPIVSLTQSSEVDRYAGWKEDQLSFDDECFQDIANRLERKYDITIRIEDPVLAACHYSGSFKGLPDITAVLDILKETTPFSYEIKKDTVILKTINHQNRIK